MRETLIAVGAAIVVVCVFTLLVKAFVPHDYVPGVKVEIVE